MSNSTSEKQLRALGMCKRAGKLVVGVPLVCESIKKGRAITVAAATGAAKASNKKIADKCSYYNIELIMIETDAQSLGAAVGSSSCVAAVAITDGELAKLFKSQE